MFGFRFRMSRASSATAGATTQSIFVDVIAWAVATSIATVQRDDAAERAQAVGLARADVRLGDGGADRDTARVRVLDHGRRRHVELEHDANRGIEIEQIRERELLALKQRRAAKAPIRRGTDSRPGARYHVAR